MERDIPEWQPFDTGLAAEDEILSRTPGGEPHFVAVLTTAGAREDGWAARVTVELARAWSRRRGRILLADLDLREPRLHLELDVENGEGMSDAFLFGASLQRIALPVDQGFLFAPAGTVVADPVDVLTAPRWAPVLDGFSRAGATLVVHLPAEAEGAGTLLDRSTDVVLLTLPGEEPGVAWGAWRDRVRAVLGPRDAAAAGAGGAAGSVGAAAAVAAGRSGVAARDGEPAGDDGPRGDEAAAADALPDDGFDPLGPPTEVPTPGARDEDRNPVAPPRANRPPRPLTTSRPPASTGSGGRTGLLLLVLVLLVLGVVVAGWLGVVDVPFVTPRGTESATAAAAIDGPRPPAPPVMTHSLALGAFQDAAVAELQAEGLSEQRQDLLFVVAPVEVDGTVFHRLLVGPAEDSVAAVALRANLARTLTREDPDSWRVLATPLAFELGTFGSRSEAEGRAEELRGLGVAAYVLQSDGGPDGTFFRLYGGAYADEAEAALMKARLEEEGLGDAPLTRRIGRIPGPAE